MGICGRAAGVTAGGEGTRLGGLLGVGAAIGGGLGASASLVTTSLTTTFLDFVFSGTFKAEAPIA